MAIVWADGFDHQGSIANCAVSGYQSFGGFLLDYVAGRTGNAVRFQRLIGGVGYRRILDDAATVIGAGLAIKPGVAPAVDKRFGIYFERGTSGGDDIRLSVCLADDLSLVARTFINDTTEVELGRTRPNLIPVGGYRHVEVGVFPGTETIQVRVDTEVVLTIIYPASSLWVISSVFVGQQGGTVAGGDYNIDTDDFIIWDGSGDVNNNFLGDMRCITLFPSADTVEADWAPSSGATGWNLIDETPPSTIDYITAFNNNEVSAFEKSAPPVEVIGVNAVRMVAFANRDDAGISAFRMGLNVGGFVEQGAKHIPGIVAAYYSSILEKQPVTQLPWTREAFEAALLTVTRDD